MHRRLARRRRGGGRVAIAARGRVAIVAAALAVLASVAAAPQAAAASAVTVGADLSLPMAPVGNCEVAAGCGLFPLTAGAPSSATASPIDGTVSAWRIDGANTVAGYTVSVLRANGDGTYTVTASAPPVTPAGAGLETFAADLPIQAGEYVALDLPYGGTVSILESTAELIGFTGPLKAGETLTPYEEEGGTFTIAFNADIEPSAPSAPPAPPSPSPSTSSSPAPAPAAPPAEGPRCVVPKLVGKKPAAAKRALRRTGCRVGLVLHRHSRKSAGKPAKVRAQAPKPGRSLPPGTEVSLELG